jgi:hypothetical protein
MNRLRFLPTMLLLAGFSTACTDDPVALPDPPFTGPDLAGFEIVNGTVLDTGSILGEDGNIIPVVGPRTKMLEGLVGAEIRVVGVPDEDGSSALWIVEFTVTAVDGLPAFDGRLDYTEEGYGLRSPDGGMIPLAELPDDLRSHVGRRIWLTIHEGALVRFGLLEE